MLAIFISRIYGNTLSAKITLICARASSRLGSDVRRVRGNSGNGQDVPSSGLCVAVAICRYECAEEEILDYKAKEGRKSVQ